MEFNTNHEVYVRLTDEGRLFHRKAHDDLNAHLFSVSPNAKVYKYRKPEEDEDGWSKWQLWELMASFGQHMYNGCKVPFETNMRIPAEALESSHAELLRVCELAVAKWFSGETSEVNMELELRSAIHYAKQATGEEK